MGRLFAGISLLLFGAVFAFGALPFFLTAAPDQPLWALGGLLFLAVAGFSIVSGARRLMAASVFQVASVKFGEPARLGGQARAQVTLVPKRALVLKPAECTLRLRTVERAEYSAGTRSRTYVETIREVPVACDFPSALEPAGFVREVMVTVPRDIPPTWRGRSNSLRTTLKVYVSIDAWPDLELEGELRVLPEVAP